MTHPAVGYRLEDLPEGKKIRQKMEETRIFARKNDIRLSFHPDQFVVLSSPHSQVVANSIRELEYHGMLADAVGADVINIHAGGVYGDKVQTLQRLKDVLPHLSAAVRKRLTLENDDVSYTPRDLLSFCERFSIPFVYDVHHHRCLPDGLSVEQATNWRKTAGRTSDRNSTDISPRPAAVGRGVIRNHMPTISIRLISRHAGWEGR